MLVFIVPASFLNNIIQILFKIIDLTLLNHPLIVEKFRVLITFLDRSSLGKQNEEAPG